MEDKTDEELAKYVQEGRTDAFGLLVVRYEDRLLRYGRRLLFDNEMAKDAVQEVFLRSFSNIQSFNVSKRFSPWIYRIAHNVFINIIKKKERESYSVINVDTLFSFSGSDGLEAISHAERAEEAERINQYLDKVHSKYREPLVLFYFENKDYREISDILTVPIATVGVRLKRGREKIKKLYENGK